MAEGSYFSEQLFPSSSFDIFFFSSQLELEFLSFRPNSYRTGFSLSEHFRL